MRATRETLPRIHFFDFNLKKNGILKRVFRILGDYSVNASTDVLTNLFWGERGTEH